MLDKDLDLIAIPKSMYKELQEKSDFLDCLMASGVDNWDGYADAQEMMDQED